MCHAGPFESGWRIARLGYISKRRACRGLASRLGALAGRNKRAEWGHRYERRHQASHIQQVADAKTVFCSRSMWRSALSANPVTLPRSKLRRSIVLPIALSVVAGAAIPVSAQQVPGSLAIVFDSSGSMWGNLPGGGAKFEVAHTALAESLPGAAEGVKTGLTIFGPGCSSTYVASPLGLRNGADTVQPLQTLNPKSKGPIAAALEDTASRITANEPSAILLVADGPDNCGGDVCAVAGQLAKDRAGMKIYTIGLGLDQPISELSCASTLTKGRFFPAPTAPAAEKAFTDAIGLALADLQIRQSPKVAKRAKSKSSKQMQIAPNAGPHLVLTAVLGMDGNDIEKPVRWRVYKSSGEPDADQLPILDVLEPRFAVPMAPGDYFIKASLGRVTFSQAARVNEKGATTVKAVFEAGTVKLSVARGGSSIEPGVEQGAGAETLISVRKADDNSGGAPLIVSPYPEGELVLPAGRYEIRAESGPEQVSRVVDVAAGRSLDLDLPLSIGELVLSVDAPLGGQQAEDLEFVVSVDDPDSPGGRRRVARSAARSPSFGLPAGTYYVEVHSGLASVSGRVALGAGKRVEKVLKLDAARLDVETDAPLGENSRPQPIVYKLFQLTPLRAVTRSSARSPSFVVAPGRYRIVAEIGARNVKAAEDIEIGPGEARKISLGVLAGNVRLNVTDSNGAALGGQYWEVLDAAGNVVWRTQLRSPRGLLAPGSYTVRCETRKGRVEGTFEVAEGDAKTVELRLQ